MGQHLHIDPFSGVSGDMLLGMLVDLGVPATYLAEELARMPLGAFSLEAHAVVRHGIRATWLDVGSGTREPHAGDGHASEAHVSDGPISDEPISDSHAHGCHAHEAHHGHAAHHAHGSHHAHGAQHAHGHQHRADAPAHHHAEGPARTLSDMLSLLGGAPYGAGVKARAEKTFRLLAETEAHIHGKMPDEVHFHELAGVDTLVDIVGTCLALEWLGVEGLTVSTVAVGSGTVACAHGDMPLPSPATAALLAGVPTRQIDCGCELATPTGAALLVALADSFGPMPEGVTRAIGYGAGTRDLPGRANVIRGLLRTVEKGPGLPTENVLQLTASVDDASGEIAGHAIGMLLEEGALDAYVRPVTMKKSRPGWELVVLVRPQAREKAVETVLRQTGSFGVRIEMIERVALKTVFGTVRVAGLPVRIKCAYANGTAWHAAPEYEDCVAVVRATGRALAEVMQEAGARFRMEEESFPPEGGIL